MNSNKVTAIATSVIAVTLLGFIFNSTYNSPQNIEKRCFAKYKRRVEKGPAEIEAYKGKDKSDYELWYYARQQYLLEECLK